VQTVDRGTGRNACTSHFFGGRKMANTVVRIFVFEDGGVNVEVETTSRVRNISTQNDLGYETDVKTYGDEEEGILYDNLD